jgi:hypothetical protein
MQVCNSESANLARPKGTVDKLCVSPLGKSPLARRDQMMSARGPQVTRQDFLRASLALAAVPLLRHVPAHAAAPAADSVEVAEIAPGVFVHQGRVEMQSPENQGDMANAGFVASLSP